MKVRYKNHPHETRETDSFNMHAYFEINMHDDSARISELEVFISGYWKDMSQAFKDKDIIPNNLNTHFGVPLSPEYKERGYNP